MATVTFKNVVEMFENLCILVTLVKAWLVDKNQEKVITRSRSIPPEDNELKFKAIRGR